MYTGLVFFPSECAVVDHSEEDEEMLSSDSEDAADTDSDEDFTPDMKTSPKRKSKRVVKTQKSQNKKVRLLSSRNPSGENGSV